MGSFDPLRVNQLVEIELFDDEMNFYRAKVVEVHPDKLVITPPVKEGAPISLANGTSLKVTFTDNVAVYSFSTEIVSQTRNFPIKITLGRPFDTKRIQRRNFVRLDTRLKTHLTKLDRNFLPLDQVISAITVDISGGGMMFDCNTSLELGDLWEALIYVSEDQSVKAVGRVIRCRENSIKAKTLFSVGFEFTIIEELERDKIIKFIFNQQRELRRKGLL